MKIKKVAVQMMAAGLLMWANQARAEVKAGQHEVGFRLGSSASMLKSDVSSIDIDMGNPGVSFNVDYLYNLTPHLGVGADTGYLAMTSKEQQNFPRAGAKTTSYARTFHFEAVARYLFLPESQHHVGLLLGAGFASLNEAADFQPTPSSIDAQLFDETATGASVSAGAQYAYELSSNWSLGFDMRWRYVSAKKSFVTTTNENGNIQAGSVLNFGVFMSRKFGG